MPGLSTVSVTGLPLTVATYSPSPATYRRARVTVLSARKPRWKIGSAVSRSGPAGVGSSTTVLIVVRAGGSVAEAWTVKSTGKFGTWPSAVRRSVRG